MTGYKTALESKTFRGLLFSFLTILLKWFGVEFAYDDAMINETITIALNIFQVVGLLIARYGRVSAIKKII